MALLDTGLDPLDPPPGIALDAAESLVSAQPPHPHARRMAAIIARVRPRARLVSLRVLDGRARLAGPGILAAALRWLCDHHRGLDVRVALLPLATRGNHQNDAHLRDDAVAALVAELHRAGVTIVCPTGNAFATHLELGSPEGMAWPAILRETVSVGASTHRLEDGVWGEVVAPRSQRLRSSATHPGTTVFAPDPDTVPRALPGLMADGARTSGAAALVAGLLLRRFDACADEEDIDPKRLLRRGAHAIPLARPDLRGAGLYPRLDAGAVLGPYQSGGIP